MGLRKTSVASPPTTLPVLSLRQRTQGFIREAIWDAAIDLFERRGFDDTTVDDIVAAAGTSRRSFFRYFESKNDLLAEPTLRFGDALCAAIDACPASATTADVLHDTVLEVSRGAIVFPRTRQVMELAAKYPAARSALLSRLADVQERVNQAFADRQGVRSTDVRARVLGALALSAVGAVCQQWLESGGTMDVAMAVDDVMATVTEVGCARATTGRATPRHASSHKR